MQPAAAQQRFIKRDKGNRKNGSSKPFQVFQNKLFVHLAMIPKEMPINCLFLRNL